MKRIIKLAAHSLIIAAGFISCKKELTCEGCKEGNKPPIAKAGADQAITLPKDSALLDGSGSTDGTISGILATRLRSPVLNIATFKPFI